MEKTLELEIRRSTWPNPPLYPTFPQSFTPGKSEYDLNVPEMLLVVGFLTTPTHAAGVSLSEYWAWVRYLSAVSSRDDMRLTQSFWDLDAHQKTILSDDLGMGVSMHWLSLTLPFVGVCDGRYFAQWMAPTLGVTIHKTRKRGPFKTPDFVTLDAQGRWHVVECKGTQSGSNYRVHQMGSIADGTTGAVSQKRTITFPRTIRGQRLACGLVLSVESSQDRSSLLVTDPEEDETIKITEDDVPEAEEGIARAIFAKELRLSGFGETSSLVAAPFGPTPSSRPTSGRSEAARRETVFAKRQRAKEEAEVSGRTVFFAGDRTYVGREARLDLPAPLVLKDRVIRRVHLRSGIEKRIVAELGASGISEELEDREVLRALVETTPVLLEHEEGEARLSAGTQYHLELRLES